MKAPHQEILARSRPRVSILDFDRQEILSLLKERLQGRDVREAYVFGSFASERAGAWSDLDVLLVKHANAPFVERPRDFWDLLDLGIAMDILVYTPEEFECLAQSDSGFWREFRKSRIRILRVRQKLRMGPTFRVHVERRNSSQDKKLAEVSGNRSAVGARN